MSKPNLQDMMSKRTPLRSHEVVEPVDMYGGGQVDKSTSPQTDKDASGQNRKPAKPLVEKYTTHLKPETIKAIKRAAVEQDRKDYEVVQAALDAYFVQFQAGVSLGDV